MIFEDPRSHYVTTDEGFWLPPIGVAQYNKIFANHHRYLLVSGPRLSGKTEAILHKVLQHAFDNAGARIAIFTITAKVGKSGGVWQDLTTRIVETWLSSGIGFQFAKDHGGKLMIPKVTGDTRQNMFGIRSRYGPTSEILLHSLEFAPEVHEKLRGTKWSMIWFSEIDQIAPLSGPEPDTRDDRQVFAAAQAQLRMEPLIRMEAHQIIMDCNPPIDGEENWLWQVFEVETQDKTKDEEYRNNFEHVKFTIDDNPFLSKQRKVDLYNSYAYRQSLLDRMYYGKWTKDSTTGHFHEMFKEEIHVLPTDPAERVAGNVIVPTPAVKVMLSGLDLGDKNNAFVIAEKLETRENDKTVIKFAVMDELIITGREMPLRVFVEAMVTMIDKWEKYCHEKYNRKITWRHWSDEAAWRYKQVAEAMDYLVVRNLSGGKINLKPAPKYKGSIRDRVQLLQQLLFENRIYFSHQLEECLTMLKVLRKGNTVADYAAPPRRVHAFDALTYMLQSEAPVDEITYSDVMVDKSPRKLILCR